MLCLDLICVCMVYTSDMGKRDLPNVNVSNRHNITLSNWHWRKIEALAIKHHCCRSEAIRILIREAVKRGEVPGDEYENWSYLERMAAKEKL